MHQELIKPSSDPRLSVLPDEGVQSANPTGNNMRKRILLAILCSFGMTCCIACDDSAIDKNNDIIEEDEDIVIEQHIFIEPQAITVSETGEGSRVVIDFIDQPLHDVTITAAISDGTELAVTPQSMVINPATWANEKSFYIAGINDGIRDGDQTATVSFSFASDDPDYTTTKPIDVEVTVLDDGALDKTGYTIKYLKELVTSEDGSKVANIDISLSLAPQADVVITMVSSKPGEGRPEPATMTFTAENYAVAQNLKIVGVDDDVLDGDQSYEVVITSASTDERYDKNEVATIKLVNLDDEVEAPLGESHTIRLMAANLTSGNLQSYDPGHGMRIMKAMQPDIIMIQEFNYTSGSLSSLVTSNFGSDYQYYCGKGQIPNGVISRYPIVSSGMWPSTEISNRDWDWAVIDIPGPRDMLVISVHLSTKRNASEMPKLRDRIKAKVTADNKNYYVVIGGDFNTSSRSSVKTHLSGDYSTGAPYPVDQNGKDGTNASREKPYDWVLLDKTLAALETPLKIGNRSYKNGHVFDSRVYQSLGELGDVPPVQAGDSKASNMQHMGVIKEITYVY